MKHISHVLVQMHLYLDGVIVIACRFPAMVASLTFHAFLFDPIPAAKTGV